MLARIATVLLTALVVLGGAATGAAARRLHLGRCALMRHAKVVAATPEVVVARMPHTKVFDGESVTNPIYYTCLRRSGRWQKLFVGASEPSPDAGYRSYVAAVRAAGHYVLYISAFTQNNPEGPVTETAQFHVVDVAHRDRHTIELPDPDIELIGVGEVAVSEAGYMAWAQVNGLEAATTETVEADTGGGPITLATAATPDTLTQLPFHKLAFQGATLTWLENGQSQSAQLTP
jgi:hypothetical protein